MLKFNKAFTLIELLVTIGVLAVIAAGVIALIDPRDKILQAADSKVQSDIGQLATAIQSFTAQRTDGLYPTTAQMTAVPSVLVSSGELVTMPNPPPQSAVYTAYTANYAVDNTTNPPVAVVWNRVASKKYTTTACTSPALPWWVWSSNVGRACLYCNANPPTTGFAVGNCAPGY